MTALSITDTNQNDATLRQILHKLVDVDGLDHQTAHNVLGDVLVRCLKECDAINVLPTTLNIFDIMNRAEEMLKEWK